MNADKIAKELHCLGDVLDRQSTDYPTGGDTCYAAADMIETLQKQLAAKDTEIARLTVERTAMLKALQGSEIDCDSCKHNGIGDCEDACFDCKNCAQDCRCKPCDGTSKWEWRGAEEG